MWSFSFFAGNFLGPTLSGIFINKFNFQEVTLFLFCVHCVMIVVDSKELLHTLFASRKKAKAGYENMKGNGLLVERTQKSNFDANTMTWY